MPYTRIASANIKRGLGWGPLQNATERLLARNVGIIGFQEIYDGRIKMLRKMLAKRGYGLSAAQDVPIAYDAKRYKLLDSNARRLPGKASKDNSNPARYGNWVALRDRKTGQVVVMTNTHLSRKRTAREAQMQRRQIRELRDLQRDLRKRYGKKADYYMTGDMNQGNRAALRMPGMRGFREPGAPIDWIFGEKRPRKETLMDTASDHDAYIATFRGDGKKKKGGKNGGGNGGNGGRDEDREDMDAFELFSELLESWGLPIGNDIERIIKKAMKDGITPDQIHQILPDIQNTRSWKRRFPGWHKRIENGYSQLSIDRYLELENQYHRIMQAAGLPAGFYDDPSDFGNWIANDVSPDEIQGRVDIAVDAAQQVNPAMKEIMQRFYGLTTGDVASYFLDQDRALPVIRHQYETAGVASWAQRAGFEVRGIRRYEDLVNAGVTMEAAAQGYGTAYQLFDTLSEAGERYGVRYNQRDAEQDVFFNQSEKRRQITSAEAATFGGSSAGMTGSARRSSY